MRANETLEYNNPYCAALGWIALASAPIGLVIMLATGSPFGALLIGLAVLSGVAWLSVEAMLWRAPSETWAHADMADEEVG